MVALKTLLVFGLRGSEIWIIALVVLLLFGGAKIPELMRGLGKGVKSFKEGVNGVEEALDDDKKKEDKKEDTKV